MASDKSDFEASYFEERVTHYERNRAYFEQEVTRILELGAKIKEDLIRFNQERMRNLYAPPRNDQNSIQITELLSYLSKQSRRRIVNNSNVKFDLELYETLVLNGETQYVKKRLITISDVEMATNSRYGFYPQDFNFKSSEIPDDVARLINTKADLTHLTFWKEATGEKVKLRDLLREKCDDLINRCMDPTNNRPYSKQEAERLLKDRQYWSM